MSIEIKEKYKKNLADLAVQLGVNLEEGQFLLINSPLETADFARLLAKAAFDVGASDVEINYTDPLFHKMRLDNVEIDTLTEVPESWIKSREEFLEKDGAVISIHAEDPDLLKTVDADKIQAHSIAREQAGKFYSDALMANKNRWCVISVPTQKWAEKVFPGQEESETMLWERILESVSANTDNPVDEWRKKDERLKKRARFLNDIQFDSLRYENSKGTNLTIGLPKNHIWSGGSEDDQSGRSFFPNIPTEEIFTAPDKRRINGVVYATYPLVHMGKVIDDIVVTFKDGKAIKVSASKNQDLLENLLDIEGADFLGEVALVPYHSPISEQKTLFYNTLFDENASCHLAFGAAYPSCIVGGTEMTPEELDKAGLNDSVIHVDFMIGDKDLKVTGIGKDGTETVIIENGDFILD